MVESCLIIGIGQIGMGYDLSLPDESEIVHTHARAIFKHPGFDLIGAVDEESPLRAAFTQRYSVPAFDRVELALRELNPTLVVISTPTHSHAEILTRVLTNHRPKLIVCEKPLAYTLKDARTMVKMCEAYGVDLIVNYMRRIAAFANNLEQRQVLGTHTQG